MVLSSRIYSSQKSNSKLRNRVPPKYTKDELKEWLKNTNFEELYNIWVSSGYDKNLKPSIDRINDLMPYTLDNIKLMTWEENMRKGHSDRANGIGASGLARCKKVIQYDKNMNFIQEYNSQTIASKRTGCLQVSISKCCRGLLNTTNGFIFKFKEK